MSSSVKPTRQSARIRMTPFPVFEGEDHITINADVNLLQVNGDGIGNGFDDNHNQSMALSLE